MMYDVRAALTGFVYKAITRSTDLMPPPSAPTFCVLEGLRPHRSWLSLGCHGTSHHLQWSAAGAALGSLDGRHPIGAHFPSQGGR